MGSLAMAQPASGPLPSRCLEWRMLWSLAQETPMCAHGSRAAGSSVGEATGQGAWATARRRSVLLQSMSWAYRAWVDATRHRVFRGTMWRVVCACRTVGVAPHRQTRRRASSYGRQAVLPTGLATLRPALRGSMLKMASAPPTFGAARERCRRVLRRRRRSGVHPSGPTPPVSQRAVWQKARSK